MTSASTSTNWFGRFVAKRREASGMGVRELARLAAISHVQLVNIEAGKRQAGIGTTLKLASGLNLNKAEWSKVVSRQLLGPNSITESLPPSEWLAALISASGVTATATGSNRVQLQLGGGRKAKLYVELD